MGRFSFFLPVALFSVVLVVGGCQPSDEDDDTSPSEALDADSDGYPAAIDCNDQDPTIHGGAPELCDGIDNNCSTLIDEGYDLDADGYVSCLGDCDDGDSSAHPGAPEVCDAEDNDCDTKVDEDFDEDGDGTSPCAGDCDDADPEVAPSMEELCDCADNDCDGTADEGLSECDALCGGALEGEWTMYVWWVFSTGLSDPYYMGPVAQMNVNTDSFSGDFQLTYYSIDFVERCSELWSISGTHQGSADCPDCIGKLENSQYSGPNSANCTFAGYPLYDAATLEASFPTYYYSDVIEPSYDLGGVTVQDFITLVEDAGFTPIYEVYMLLNGGEMTPSGLLYQ